MKRHRQPLAIQQRLAGSAQFLNPEAIYTLNKQLNAIIDTSAQSCTTDIEYDKDYWVTPVLYRKSSRTWHSACVIDAWGVQEGEELALTNKNKFLGDALKLIARLWAGYNEANGSALAAQLAGCDQFFGKKPSFKEAYISFVLYQDYLIEDRKYEKAHCYIEKCLHRLNNQFQHEDILHFSNDQNGLSYLAKQLNLISEQRQIKHEECQEFIRNLLLLYHGFKIHRDLLLAGILYRNTKEYSKQGIAWIEGTWTDDKLDELELYFHLTQNGSQNDIQKDHQMSSSNVLAPEETITFQEIASQRGAAFLSELANIFYLARIGQGSNVTVNKMPLLIVPVYDCWIGSIGCGNLWGCLILTFNDNKTLNTFKQNLLPYFHQQTRDLANSLTNSAMTRIASREIIPPYDLIEFFLNCLVATQDWEWISVFRGKEKDKNQELLYCYHRPVTMDNYGEDAQWKRCAKKCIPQCHGNTNILKWEKYDFSPWNQEMIPELTEEEITSFGELTFHFGYPDSTWIPGSSTLARTREIFELTLIEQQLRVLRTLVTKVQARRSSLRNAVVSIMGRNMSHNIGSHVLARFAAQEQEKSDSLQVKQFIRYLQERMDFIADISTTEVFYSLPVRFYADTMVGLIGRKNTCDGHKIRPQEILLNNISGLNDVRVEIIPQNQQTEDFVYDSPGGRMGMQAVYVILENIARNTAKHDNLGSNDIKVDFEQLSATRIKFSLTLGSQIKEKTQLLLRIEKKCCEIKPNQIKAVCLNDQKIQPFYFQQLVVTGQTMLNGGKAGWKLNDLNTLEVELAPGTALKTLANIRITLVQQITLHIRIEEPANTENDQLLKVLVWDDRNSCCQINQKDAGEWLPDIINGKLHEPMIFPSGEIEPNNWGIREIFLAASYLREIKLSDLESREIWPGDSHAQRAQIVEAVAVDKAGNEILDRPDDAAKQCELYSLGYRFYLKKKHLLLEIAEEGKNWASQDTSHGIQVDFTSAGTIKPHFYNLLIQRKGLLYSSIILPETVHQELTSQQKVRLPIMCFDRQKFKKRFCSDRVEAQLAEIWWQQHLTDRLSLRKDTFKLYRTGDDVQRQSLIEHLSIEKLSSFLEQKSVKQNNYLLFDDHGVLYNHLKKAGKVHLLNRLSFYEPFRKKNQQYDLIYSDNMESSLHELKTAAKTNIIILDERIQAVLPKSYDYDGLTFGQLFSWMGIHVPDVTQINLDEIKSRRDDLFRWLAEDMIHIFRNQGRKTVYNDYIVIHQTIIDKLREVYGEAFDNDFFQMAQELGCADRIVICSGRGNPRNSLPKFARFIPVSAILQWTVNNPSKYHLVNLLCHARQPDNNGEHLS